MGGVLSGEKRTVLFGLTAAVLAVFYIYVCLYGYPLLDNHITTAWLMTGRYTSTLVLSILKLFAGLFGNSLTKHYDPEGDDKEMERIVRQVESGQI